eukprot:1816754-Prymnesium_polylepis.1
MDSAGGDRDHWTRDGPLYLRWDGPRIIVACAQLAALITAPRPQSTGVVGREHVPPARRELRDAHVRESCDEGKRLTGAHAAAKRGAQSIS